jgi:hypothetical protein
MIVDFRHSISPLGDCFARRFAWRRESKNIRVGRIPQEQLSKFWAHAFLWCGHALFESALRNFRFFWVGISFRSLRPFFLPLFAKGSKPAR